MNALPLRLATVHTDHELDEKVYNTQPKAEEASTVYSVQTTNTTEV